MNLQYLHEIMSLYMITVILNRGGNILDSLMTPVLYYDIVTLVSLQNAQIFRLLLKISVEGNTQMSLTLFLKPHFGFPFSLENIPRQNSFACLSLKFGSVLSALILIFYSIFGLASCLAALNVLPLHFTPEDTDVIFSYAVIVVVAITHAIILFLSTLMIVGVLKGKANLMKPWVIFMSLQVLVELLVFVFWTTIGMIHHYGDSMDLLLYVLEFLRLMIRFYMLMIVSSYYRQLEQINLEEKEKLRNILNDENWYNTV